MSVRRRADPPTQAAQLVFPGFRFGHDDPARAEALVELGVGGFCLYGGKAPEIAAFTARLQTLAQEPLLFCADYEDGAASHCQGATALPSNMGVAASGRPDLARLKAEVTAREALALGVRWVLAPVVDLAVEPGNPIVNVRSFGSAPALVGKLARAYMLGLRGQGVLGCLKHFPGHGRTRRDSHLELPIVTASRALLRKSDLAPFSSLAASADSIMVGHLAVPAWGGGEEPFTLSEASRRLLRRGLGFKGLVSTDALDMHAISELCPQIEAALRALRAGADILLVPKDSEALARGLAAAVSEQGLEDLASASLARLRRAKAKAGLFHGSPGPMKELLAAVGGARHLALAERMAQACLAWHGKPAALQGRSLAYAEPGASQKDWRGLDFLAELKRLGASVRPASGPLKDNEALVLGFFRRPRAYSGRIGLESDELKGARRLLSGAREAVIASFGSPFLLSDFPGQSGLCAFSSIPASQRAAAHALLGSLLVLGRMPVSVD